MSRNKEVWNTKENAEAYDIYAKTFPMYKDTSNDLVIISDIKPGTVVVDLAAGTGATTQAILDKTDGNIRIIAVDQAEEMLNKAKEKFTGGNVEFIAVEAEELDKSIIESVDAVLCNSAFWQMKSKSTLRAVSHILKKDGIFAFNLPDSFFSYKGFKKSPINPAPYSLDDLITSGKEVGLALTTETIKAYDKTIEEMLAFNEIPVMKRNFASEEEKNEYREKLKETALKNPSQKREWVYFVFKKQ